MLLAVKESIKLNREKDLLLAYTESLTTSQDVSQVTLPALSLSTVSTDTNGVDFVKEKKPKKKKKKNGPDSADSSPPVRRKPKPKPLGITGTNSKAFIFDHLSLNPHFFTDKLPLPKFSSFDDHGSLNSSVAFEIGDGAFQNINGNDNEDKIAGMGVLAMDEVHMQQMINDRDRLNSDNGAQDNRGRPKEIEAHGEDHSFAPSSANSASSARSGSTAHSNISNLQPPKNYSIASIMKRSEDKDGNSANTRVTNTAEGDNNDFYDDYQDGFEEEDKREEKKGEQEFKVRDNREPDFRPHIDHASKASAYGHNEEAHVLGGRENSPSNTLIMNAYAFEESDHQADPHKYNSHKGVKLADDYNLVIDEEKKWKPDPHKYDKNHKLHQHHPHHHESPHKSRSPHSPHTSQPTTPVLVGGEKNSDEADLATPVLTSLQLSAPVPQSATDVKQEEEPYEYGYQLEAGVNGDHFTDALPINHHDQASASPAESTEKEVEGKVLALELGEEEEKYTDEDFDAESPSKPDAPVSVPVVEPETEAETIVVSASGSQSGSRPTTPYREFATKYVTRALTPELTSRPATPKETDTFKVEVEKVDEGNDEETVATAETVDQGAASAILPAEIEAEIKMETDENTVEKAGIVLDAKVKEDLDEQIDVEATGAPAVGAQAVTEIGTEKDKGAEKEEVETDEGLPSYDEAIAEEGTAAAAPLQEHNIQNQHTIIEGGAATVDPISGNADKNADANVRVGADVGADVGPSALEVKAEETVPDAATAMDANANADAGVDENTGTVMTEASETDSIVVPVLAAASEKAKIDEPEAVTLTAESI